jgi:hypothetical protein
MRSGIARNRLKLRSGRADRVGRFGLLGFLLRVFPRLLLPFFHSFDCIAHHPPQRRGSAPGSVGGFWVGVGFHGAAEACHRGEMGGDGLRGQHLLDRVAGAERGKGLIRGMRVGIGGQGMAEGLEDQRAERVGNEGVEIGHVGRPWVVIGVGRLACIRTFVKEIRLFT